MKTRVYPHSHRRARLKFFRRPILTAVAATSAVLLGFGFHAVPSGAATDAYLEGKLETPHSLCSANANDGKDELLTVIEKTKKMKAYVFDSKLRTFKDGKEIVETGKLYFKSPNLVRFEVNRGGKRSGAVVIRQPDGKIRGKMGGALGGIKVTLSPDSKMLKTSNGFSVLESDLGSLLETATDKINQNHKCIAGKIPGASHQLLEIIEGDGDVVYRLVINPNLKLPEQWSIFENDKLFSTAQFDNIQVLADLPDTLFTFGKEAGGTASDRDVRVAPSQYRLECDRLRHEMLAESIKEMSNSGTFDEFKKASLKKAVATLADDVAFLKGETVVATDSPINEWLPGGKEQLVVKCTEMELILSALAPVIEAKGETIGPDTTKKLVECRHRVADALSTLLDEVEEDEPSPDDFKTLVDDLDTRITDFQAVINEVMK